MSGEERVTNPSPEQPASARAAVEPPSERAVLIRALAVGWLLQIRTVGALLGSTDPLSASLSPPSPEVEDDAPPDATDPDREPASAPGDEIGVARLRRQRRRWTAEGDPGGETSLSDRELAALADDVYERLAAAYEDAIDIPSLGAELLGLDEGLTELGGEPDTGPAG